MRYIISTMGYYSYLNPVSYTHLDVYKRQVLESIKIYPKAIQGHVRLINLAVVSIEAKLSAGYEKVVRRKYFMEI